MNIPQQVGTSIALSVGSNSNEFENKENTEVYRERADAGNYNENMTPWAGNDAYYFGCCTEDGTVSQSRTGDSKSTKNDCEATSVYHRKGSQRLIIKTKKETSALVKTTNNKLLKFLLALDIVLSICGAIFVFIEGSEWIGALFIVAAVALLALIMRLFCKSGMRYCCQKVGLCCSASMEGKEFDLVTQSIPIHSIFYVERQVSQAASVKGCCCKAPSKFASSIVSIGYNRSNLSRTLQTAASVKDFVSVNLESMQAYNLHQYVNSIIDGKHPQTKGDAAIQDVLPR